MSDTTDPVVRACAQAYTDSIRNSKARGLEGFVARKEAATAFQSAMPALSSPENICAFVTCVTHGLLLDIFLPTEARSLLYAAQVASSVQRTQHAMAAR